MIKRALLIAELILLCGPAIAVLSLGLIYFPVLLLGSLSGKGDLYLGALMVFCGTWGVISLTGLAWHTLGTDKNWPGRPVQWFGITLGVIACIIALSTMSKNVLMILIFTGPNIALAHLLYLSKKRTEAP